MDTHGDPMNFYDIFKSYIVTLTGYSYRFVRTTMKNEHFRGGGGSAALSFVSPKHGSTFYMDAKIKESITIVFKASKFVKLGAIIFFLSAEGALSENMSFLVVVN